MSCRSEISALQAGLVDPTFRTVTIEKTIFVFASQGGGWNDIVGFPQTRTTGGAIPSLSQIGSTNYWLHKFQVNDEMWFQYE